MLSIVSTTNYNTNFKAVPMQPNMKVLSDQISAIAAGEVIPKEAVQRSIPKMLSILSSIPLIGWFANLYIIHLERAAKQEQLKQEQIEIANKQAERLKEEALKLDSNGKTMVLRLLEKDQFEAFRKHVEKYPDVLLIRANDGNSCLTEAVYLYKKCTFYTKLAHTQLVNYIAEKLVSNPDYNPNEQAKSYVLTESRVVAYRGDTDAHILARVGLSEAFKIIASHPNVDLTIRNADGKTCMDVALENNRGDIVDFLATKM